jgi:cytochrome bd-type quinol oxidase subunit 2
VSDATEPSTSEQRTAAATRSGPGRLLIAVYGVFALAATARSAVQISTRFSVAPLAFALSAVAAVVYLLATFCLATGTRTTRAVATASLILELAGVLLVGTLSLMQPGLFPEATVWSDYGQGYGFIPVVLPVLGLAWLRRTARLQPDPT